MQQKRRILSESKQQQRAVLIAKEPAAKELAVTALKEVPEVLIQKRPPMSFQPINQLQRMLTLFVDLAAPEQSLVARDLSDDKVACLLARYRHCPLLLSRPHPVLSEEAIQLASSIISSRHPIHRSIQSQVGRRDRLAGRHCDADIMLDGGSNVNIVDDSVAGGRRGLQIEWGVKILPTSRRARRASPPPQRCA